MGTAAVRTHGRAQTAARCRTRCAACPHRNPATHRAGVHRRTGAVHEPRNDPVIRHLSIALLLARSLGACGGGASEEAGHAHEESGQEEGGHEEGEHAEEARKGEHGGRLLEQTGYAVELAIAEEGTPPKYQAWLYRDG